jgi:hypothetical protein
VKNYWSKNKFLLKKKIKLKNNFQSLHCIPQFSPPTNNIPENDELHNSNTYNSKNFKTARKLILLFATGGHFSTFASDGENSYIKF